MWKIWCKALGQKEGKNNREADAVAVIRTCILIGYMVTNCFIIAGVVRHWNSNSCVSVDTESILEIPIKDKIELKEKYNIKTSVNLIFSARFITKERRTDLLLEVMDKLDKKKYGLIIIGDGPLKPNFSEYTNIYDFGLVYDIQIKSDLFQIADLYFQPGWLGLSCNEALAQAKGVLTFKRSDKVKQCVEYGYLNKDFSFIAENVEEMVDFLEHINDSIIQEFSVNARNYAKTNLLMSQMVKNADESLRRLIK
jgi:glycosyltransferase involved in cell wall biosynthesis